MKNPSYGYWWRVAFGQTQAKGAKMTKFSRVLAASALAAGAGLPLLAGVAHADPDPCYLTCPPKVQVAPADISRSAPVAQPVSAANVARNQSSAALPFTGTDVIELSLIGVGAVAAGTVLVRRSRRTA
jgi:hypothetical protein